MSYSLTCWSTFKRWSDIFFSTPLVKIWFNITIDHPLFIHTELKFFKSSITATQNIWFKLFYTMICIVTAQYICITQGPACKHITITTAALQTPRSLIIRRPNSYYISDLITVWELIIFFMWLFMLNKNHHILVSIVGFTSPFPIPT